MRASGISILFAITIALLLLIVAESSAIQVEELAERATTSECKQQLLDAHVQASALQQKDNEFSMKNTQTRDCSQLQLPCDFYEWSTRKQVQVNMDGSTGSVLDNDDEDDAAAQVHLREQKIRQRTAQTQFEAENTHLFELTRKFQDLKKMARVNAKQYQPQSMVFVISTHQIAGPHFKHLLKALLYKPKDTTIQNKIVIHIDAKVPQDQVNDLLKYVEQEQYTYCNTNEAITENCSIHLLHKRYNCTWSGYNFMRQFFVALDYIAKTFSHQKYQFIHWISGNDYALMSPDEMGRHLSMYQQELNSKVLNFVEVKPLAIDSYKPQLLDKVAVECDNYVHVAYDRANSSLENKVVFNKSKFFIGSNWFTLHMDFVKWLLEQTQSQLFKFFETVPNPDETMIQTLIMHSPSQLRKTIVNDNLRFIEFNSELLHCYHGKIADYCGTHPETLTLEKHSVQELTASGDFFARKFSGTAKKNDTVSELVLELEQVIFKP